MYFQVCSNSAYLQHSGEQYRTSGPLVSSLYYVLIKPVFSRSILGVACERKSVLLFDPFSGKLIGHKSNAHTDCVNCVK